MNFHQKIFGSYRFSILKLFNPLKRLKHILTAIATVSTLQFAQISVSLADEVDLTLGARSDLVTTLPSDFADRHLTAQAFLVRWQGPIEKPIDGGGAGTAGSGYINRPAQDVFCHEENGLCAILLPTGASGSIGKIKTVQSNFIAQTGMNSPHRLLLAQYNGQKPNTPEDMSSVAIPLGCFLNTTCNKQFIEIALRPPIDVQVPVDPSGPGCIALKTCSDEIESLGLYKRQLSLDKIAAIKPSAGDFVLVEEVRNLGAVDIERISSRARSLKDTKAQLSNCNLSMTHLANIAASTENLQLGSESRRLVVLRLAESALQARADCSGIK